MGEGIGNLISVLLGPGLVIAGMLALWENEGRFDYYKAAKNTVAVTDPYKDAGESVSFTSKLNTRIPIHGEYLNKFVSYHMVSRHAKIYSWERRRKTGYSLGWHSSVQNNERNSGLQQKLTSKKFYPGRYELGGMKIARENIHFADESTPIPLSSLQLTSKGRSLRLQQQPNHLYLSKGRSDNLGDERVSYRGIPNTPVASYFGVVLSGVGVGHQFEANTGIISKVIANDGILHHLVNGNREQALKTINADFKRVVLYTRIGGTVAIILGIHVFLSSFTSLLYRIPLLGGLIETGVLLVSAVIGLPIAGIVIATSMFFHNLFNIVLPLVIMFLGARYLIKRSKATKKNARKMLKSRLSGQKASVSTDRHPAAPVFDHSPSPAPAAALAESQSTPVKTKEEMPIRTESEIPGQNESIEQTFIHLAMLALAEGGLNKKENKMLVTWGKNNGITKDRMKALFEQAKDGEINSHPSTQEDLELLTCMALIDGELSKKEWSMLVKFASKMQRSAYDVLNIISDIESGKLVPA